MCGPGPRLNFVSGCPSGCRITNETVGRLARRDRAGGVKSASWNVRAAPIVGKLGPDEPPPQPASTSATRPSGASLRITSTSLVGKRNVGCGGTYAAELDHDLRARRQRDLGRGPVVALARDVRPHRLSERNESSLCVAEPAPQMRNRSPSRSFAPALDLDDPRSACVVRAG